MAEPEVVIVGGDDNTVLTIEQVVSIVTVEKIVEIQSSTDTADTIVVAPDDTSVVTENEIVNIVELDEEPVIITDTAIGPPGVKGDKGDRGDKGDQGIQGTQGTSAASAAIFITNVTASGIVGSFTYEPSTPPNQVMESCSTDSLNVRVHVVSSGPVESYSPTVTVNGVPAIMSETSTKRWFSGYADITLVPGANVVTAEADGGSVDTATITVLGSGPAVQSVVFGAYPGSQTELKAGDVISFTITTDMDATNVTINAGGAAQSAVTVPVTAGVATGNITISSASGAQTVTVKAQNSFGTYGADFPSSALTLNQTYPTFSAVVVAYNGGKQALEAGESSLLTCTVSNSTSVSYSSPHLSFGSPSTYSVTKSFTNTFSGYFGSGSNITITATRAANGAVASTAGLAKIATVAATGAISITPSGRLTSSAAGIDYTVRITPSQQLSSAPSLNASHGAWQGAWTASGSDWIRTLRITDAVARGTGTFTDMVLTNLSLLTDSVITSGQNYTVGGFSSRAVTFPAFSRVAPIGVNVADQTKTTAQLVGGASMTRYTDNAIHADGYYIANSDGTYNPTGSYLGLSDSVFAGSNTSGTLQASIQEVA